MGLDGPIGRTSWTDQLDWPARQTSWTDQLDRPTGRTSCTGQLNRPAKRTSWTDQLDGRAGQTSWTDQLDAPAGRTSLRTSWTDQLDRPVLFIWSLGQFQYSKIFLSVCTLSQLPSPTKALFWDRPLELLRNKIITILEDGTPAHTYNIN